MKKFILFIICAVFMTGCSMREYNIEHDPEKVAESDSIDYIQRKYGFTPEIIRSGDIVDFGVAEWKWSSEIIVQMSYDDREFMVLTNLNAKKERTICVDNYQYPEIKAELENYLCQNIDGIEGVYLTEGRYSPNHAPVESIFLYEDDLFGENNFGLRDALERKCPEIAVWLVDKDISNDEDFSFLNTFTTKCSVEFISFRSEKLMDEFLNSEFFDYNTEEEILSKYIDSYRICESMNGGVEDKYKKFD